MSLLYGFVASLLLGVWKLLISQITWTSPPCLTRFSHPEPYSKRGRKEELSEYVVSWYYLLKMPLRIYSARSPSMITSLPVTVPEYVTVGAMRMTIPAAPPPFPPAPPTPVVAPDPLPPEAPTPPEPAPCPVTNGVMPAAPAPPVPPASIPAP